MSKYRVNVCLPPSAAADVEGALAEAMAPFDMNRGDAFDPDATWDWYRVDAGRQRFAVKPRHDGDPRLIHADPVVVGTPHEPLRCDGGPRGLLDFDACRRAARTEAQAYWQAQQRDFERLVEDHPPAEPLTVFLARHAADPEGYPREQAVADHHAQPLIKALNHRSVFERYPSLGAWVLGPDTDPITVYSRDPEPGFELAETWAVARAALLTLEGEWTGIKPYSHEPDEESDTFARRSTAYLEALDEDCVVVRLLCHC